MPAARFSLVTIREAPHSRRIGRNVCEVALNIFLAEDIVIAMKYFLEYGLVEPRRFTLRDHDPVVIEYPVNIPVETLGK